MTRLSLACVALALATKVAAQASRTNLGALTCTLSEVADQQKAPAAEERAMRCAFKPTNAGAELTYSGTIRQIGQGQLPGGKLVMIWVVQGPADTKLEPGAAGPNLRWRTATNPERASRFCRPDRRTQPRHRLAL